MGRRCLIAVQIMHIVHILIMSYLQVQRLEGVYLKPLDTMQKRMRILILTIIIMAGLKIGQKGLPRFKHVIQ